MPADLLSGPIMRGHGAWHRDYMGLLSGLARSTGSFKQVCRHQ